MVCDRAARPLHALRLVWLQSGPKIATSLAWGKVTVNVQEPPEQVDLIGPASPQVE
jgi:hypothetical protein